MAQGRKGITHIAPDEANGHAGSPDFSSEHTASGFAWGVRQLGECGVYETPGNFSNSVTSDFTGFGDGFKKP